MPFLPVTHESTVELRVQMAISSVDVLCSFAAFSQVASGPSCRPTLVPKESDGAIFQLKGLWHPCAVGISGGSIVPNDLTLGTRHPPLPLPTPLMRHSIQSSSQNPFRFTPAQKAV